MSLPACLMKLGSSGENFDLSSYLPVYITLRFIKQQTKKQLFRSIYKAVVYMSMMHYRPRVGYISVMCKTDDLLLSSKPNARCPGTMCRCGTFTLRTVRLSLPPSRKCQWCRRNPMEKFAHRKMKEGKRKKKPIQLSGRGFFSGSVATAHHCKQVGN